MTVAGTPGVDHVSHFIEVLCTRRGLHSALGYITPGKKGAGFRQAALIPYP